MSRFRLTKERKHEIIDLLQGQPPEGDVAIALLDLLHEVDIQKDEIENLKSELKEADIVIYHMAQPVSGRGHDYIIKNQARMADNLAETRKEIQ